MWMVLKVLLDSSYFRPTRLPPPPILLYVKRAEGAVEVRVGGNPTQMRTLWKTQPPGLLKGRQGLPEAIWPRVPFLGAPLLLPTGRLVRRAKAFWVGGRWIWRSDSRRSLHGGGGERRTSRILLLISGVPPPLPQQTASPARLLCRAAL